MSLLAKASELIGGFLFPMENNPQVLKCGKVAPLKSERGTELTCCLKANEKHTAFHVAIDTPLDPKEPSVIYKWTELQCNASYGQGFDDVKCMKEFGHPGMHEAEDENISYSWGI